MGLRSARLLLNQGLLYLYFFEVSLFLFAVRPPPPALHPEEAWSGKAQPCLVWSGALLLCIRLKCWKRLSPEDVLCATRLEFLLRNPEMFIEGGEKKLLDKSRLLLSRRLPGLRWYREGHRSAALGPPEQSPHKGKACKYPTSKFSRSIRNSAGLFLSIVMKGL